MSATKDMWMDEVERTREDFASERLSREEASTKLRRMGFDHQEVQDMLDEAIA